jgi:hypothetical protein
VLDVALADGALTEEQRELVLRNAADSNDAQLCGGTAPFTYGSAGTFTLEAAVSRNLKNGPRAGARARRRGRLGRALRRERAHDRHAARLRGAASARPGLDELPRAAALGPGPRRDRGPARGRLGDARVAGAGRRQRDAGRPRRCAAALAGRAEPRGHARRRAARRLDLARRVLRRAAAGALGAARHAALRRGRTGPDRLARRAASASRTAA